MLLEPLKIMKEKIPFLEYVYRSLFLLFLPKVESRDELLSEQSKMKYALLDIFLGASLWTITVLLVEALHPDIRLSQVLALFKNKDIAFINITFYAYSAVVMVFMVFIIPLMIRPIDGLSLWESLFLIGLHYARCHGIFLFLFLPFCFFMFHEIIFELMNIKQLLSGARGWLIVGFLGWILFYCCVIPIAKFWKPFNHRFYSALLVSLLVCVAFGIHRQLPSIGEIHVNEGKMKEIMIQSLNND